MSKSGAPMFPAEMVGPYKIVRRLGLGESTEVLLATATGENALDRLVVVKRLTARFAEDQTQRDALMVEAMACARLAHPALVHIYDFFTAGGHLALVLEYVDGPSLAQLVGLLRAHGAVLTDEMIYFITSRVFAALASAHAAHDPKTGEAAPVVHRDVSPGNVLIPWDGFVKLSDFGLAKIVGVSENTRGGLLKGTFGYMAPEQVIGDPVTPATDVYLGCLLLRELLLGRPAFVQSDIPELEYLALMASPRLAPLDALRGGISPQLADALRRGLTPEASKRNLSALEMVHVLRAQADMDAAHEALVGALSRVRPRGRIDSVTDANARPATAPQSRVNAGLAPRTPTPPVSSRPASSRPPDDDPSSRSSERWPPPSGRTSTSELRSTMTLPSTPPPPRLVVGTPRSVAPVAGSVLATAPSTAKRRSSAFVFFGAFAVSAAVVATAVIVVASGGVDGVKAGLVARFSGLPSTTSATLADVAVAPPLPVPSALPLKVDPSTAAAAAAPSASAPAAASATKPVAAVQTGSLHTPPNAKDHRVFVDGDVVTLHSGTTVHVPCGHHVVRIGSNGNAQTVNVPCGGAVTVRQ